jgi:hypothetical protein
VILCALVFVPIWFRGGRFLLLLPKILIFLFLIFIGLAAFFTRTAWTWILIPPLGFLLMAALTGLGSSFLRLIGLRPPALLPEITLGAVTGCWLVATGSFVLGVLGLSSPLMIRLWWLLAILLGLPRLIRMTRESFQAGKSAWMKMEPVEQTVLGFAVIFGVFVLAGSLFPPMDYDALEYHLALPRHYLIWGGIRATPNNFYAVFPQGAEMLYMGALAIIPPAFAGSILANALHAAAFLTALPGCFYAARRWSGSRQGGSIATLLLAAGFFAQWSAGRAHVELFQLQAAAAALACLAAPGESWPNRWALPVCTGIAAGWAACLKYTSIPCIALPIALYWLVTGLREKSGPGSLLLRLLPALVFTGTTILLWLPWGIRNLVWTGDPLFPLLADFLPWVHWDPVLSRQFYLIHTRPPTPPWTLAMDLADQFGGGAREIDPDTANRLGPLFWVLPAAALAAWRKPVVRALIAWYLLVLLLWLTTTFHVQRYVFFLAPAAAILASTGLVQCSISERASKVLLWGVIGITIIWLPFQCRYSWGIKMYANILGADIRGIERKSGVTLEDEVLAYLWQGPGLANEFRYWMALDQTVKAGIPVWLVGEAQTYHIDPNLLTYATVFTHHPLEHLVKEADDAEALHQALIEAGNPALAFHWEELSRLETSRKFTDLETGEEQSGYWRFSAEDWEKLKALLNHPGWYRRLFPTENFPEVPAGPDWSQTGEELREWAMSYSVKRPAGPARAPRVEIFIPD